LQLNRYFHLLTTSNYVASFSSQSSYNFVCYVITAWRLSQVAICQFDIMNKRLINWWSIL